jgi:hypothetical protein
MRFGEIACRSIDESELPDSLVARPKGIDMTVTDHYHDRIARATKRLAQLQARELLAGQKRVSKAREASKREQVKRRQHISSLVALAGAEDFEDTELLGALLNHIDARSDLSLLQRAVERGELHLKAEERQRRRTN